MTPLAQQIAATLVRRSGPGPFLSALFGLVAVAAPRSALPCTAFALGEGEAVTMAKSYDWRFGDGLVVVNPRGLAKQALPIGPSDKPARWVATHGSVTFNQYGRELPNGGMNDAGLAMEVLWLDSSRFPPADERPALNELQLVQYALDTSGTVAELLELVQKVRVAKVYGAVHYFACDRTGACASLELIEGALVITSGPKLHVKALANERYDDALAALEAAPPSKRLAKGTGSRQRFLRAGALVSAQPKKGEAPSQRALKILDSVAQPNFTRWNIVYELPAGRLSFRSDSARSLKTLDLSKLDFSCAAPVKVLDLNTPKEGDALGQLHDYSSAENEKLVRTSLAKTHVELSEPTVEALVAYPTRLPCTLTKPGEGGVQ